MIKRTPQEWADFTGCWVAIDENCEGYAYTEKPERKVYFWQSLNNILRISIDLIDYSGDWKDSLAWPPDPLFEEGELVVRDSIPFCYGTWSGKESSPESWRRPTVEELKKWFPGRRIEK